MAKPGARDVFNLMFNCRRLLDDQTNKSMRNWVLACELFAVGMTSAIAICKEAEIDPDSRIVQKIKLEAP